MVAGISPADTLQPDLFTFDPDRWKKNRKISESVDWINRTLGADTVILASQQYREKETDGKNIKFVNAIRHALRSPDYTTRLGAFTVS